MTASTLGTFGTIDDPEFIECIEKTDVMRPQGTMPDALPSGWTFEDETFTVGPPGDAPAK